MDHRERVCNSANTCAQAAQTITVTAAVLTPTVSHVLPSPVPASNGIRQLTINGSNFVSGATVTCYHTDGESYPGHVPMFVNFGQIIARRSTTPAI